MDSGILPTDAVVALTSARICKLAQQRTRTNVAQLHDLELESMHEFESMKNDIDARRYTVEAD
jgi:hypothetical protein